MNRLLNPAQAVAVYDAMCALNNVNGVMRYIHLDRLSVFTLDTGVIIVEGIINKRYEKEQHASHLAFAEHYNLTE